MLLLGLLLCLLVISSAAAIAVLAAENRAVRRELADLRHLHYGDVDQTVVSHGDDDPTLTMRRPS